MELNFFGRGSGFSRDHTSAYFSTPNNELVIIDCSVSTFFKLEQMDLSRYEKIYVLITHTHGDHISGLGLFAQYTFFTMQKLTTIIAPSDEVASDISTVLTIEGNESSWYDLITVNDLKNAPWYSMCIKTEHSPQLKDKCFGYILKVHDTIIIYTGDTSTLKPFEPYYTSHPPFSSIEIYVDTSVYYGMIHLKLEDALEDFKQIASRGIKVYLMHLDNVAAAKKIVADIPNIEIVTTIESNFPNVNLDIDKYGIDVNTLFNSYITDDILIDMIIKKQKNNRDIILSIAKDNSTTSSILARMVHSYYPWNLEVCDLIAKHPNASSETLAVLAKSCEVSIRLAVVNNINTSLETLCGLQDDSEKKVSLAAKEVLFKRI